ncbi:MAG: O-antigen ligase family protein [Sporolactobacillus sp.]
MDKKILKCIICFYPVLDIVYSVSVQLFHTQFPLSQYIRIGILAYLFIWLTQKRDKLIIFTLFVLMIVGEFTYYSLGNGAFFADIQYISKILLFVTVIFSFDYIIKNNILTINEIVDYIIRSSYIITISVIIGLFGIGFNTYVDGRAGVKGLFLVQNAITATLLIITPYNLYAFEAMHKKIYIVSYILALFSLLIIGTKAGVAGVIYIFIIQYINYIIKSSVNSIKLSIYSFSVAISALCLFLEWNKLVGFFNYQVSSAQRWGDMFSYIVSNRNLQIMWVQSFINTKFTFNPLWYFGVGFNTANNVLQANGANIIEMDIYGILYYSGIWILLLIIIIIIKRVYFSALLVIREKATVKSFVFLLALSVGLIHSFYGGHVIYEALTSLYFGISLSLVKAEFLHSRELSQNKYMIKGTLP